MLNIVGMIFKEVVFLFQELNPVQELSLFITISLECCVHNIMYCRNLEEREFLGDGKT